MAFPATPVPDHIEESERKYLTDEQTAEDGTKYTYLRRDKLFRVWKLTWEALSSWLGRPLTGAELLTRPTGRPGSSALRELLSGSRLSVADVRISDASPRPVMV